jgi:23S rRNA (uridine2552-2'-O)-methyltransferase
MPQIFQNLNRKKRFKKSSQKWLLRQINDQFVEKAKIEGYRSRATFKIIEIDEKFKIFKKNKIVIDLGCAPGGWSQYAVEKVGAGNIIAIDLLPISPIAGVNFFQQDFLEENASTKIREELGKIPYNPNNLCDIVMSDMASNSCGDHDTDHLRIIILLEEALNLATQILRKNGCFIGKIFQGGSSSEILKKLRQHFSQVKYFKPDSSRKDSSETYLIATGFKIDLKKIAKIILV